MKESWQPVQGLDTYVSDLGRVRGPRESVHVKQSRGYQQVGIWDGKRSATYLVHRLVMAAFVGPSSQEINHKDDKTNNRLSNLEYCSSENVHHAVSNGQRLFRPEAGS